MNFLVSMVLTTHFFHQIRQKLPRQRQIDFAFNVIAPHNDPQRATKEHYIKQNPLLL